MARETIGTRIQRIREDRGMTASDLARLVDVTPTAVWNWEKNGTRPRANVLSSVAKALGVTQELLVTGNTSKNNGATIDQVLEAAAAQIAKINGVEPDRVKLSFRIAME